MLRLIFLLIAISSVYCDLKLLTNEIAMEVNSVQTFKVEFNATLEDTNTKLLLLITDDSFVVVPNYLELLANQTYIIQLKSLKTGRSEISVISATIFPKIICKEAAVLTLRIYKSELIENSCFYVGWLYCTAWSFSFYPQIYINYKWKSVIGLSFDYAVFNVFGYFMYNVFNLGMFFLPVVKEEYAQLHPKSINPVNKSDIFFSVHTMIATLVTMLQCLKYYSGNQKVSTICKICTGIGFVATLVMTNLAAYGTVLWLDVFYTCSYIKLIVTVAKYVPQVCMNYKRKGTMGWSTCGVGLDFTGGVLCVIQVVLVGYNYDDWSIIMQNLTKFGLGIVSVTFDVVFLLQHYVVYTKQMVVKRDQTNCFSNNAMFQIYAMSELYI